MYLADVLREDSFSFGIRTLRAVKSFLPLPWNKDGVRGLCLQSSYSGALGCSWFKSALFRAEHHVCIKDLSQTILKIA